MPGDFGLKELLAMSPQATKRIFLVDIYMSAVSVNISGKNGRKLPINRRFSIARPGGLSLIDDYVFRSRFGVANERDDTPGLLLRLNSRRLEGRHASFSIAKGGQPIFGSQVGEHQCPISGFAQSVQY